MKDINILINSGVNVNRSLELLGDMEMYDDTLSTFLHSLELKINNLNKYKDTSNMASYKIAVHGLKSDAKYLGFTNLADLAYTLEIKSDTEDINFINDHHDEMIAEVRRLESVCKLYIGEEEQKVVVESPVSEKSQAILVADDSNLVSSFIKNTLKDKYDVYVAQDGAEAIEIINGPNKEKILGCLIDLNMPNVNGYEFLEYCKQNSLFSKHPVSIITGTDTREQIENAFKYPIIDLLIKPFDEKTVIKIIEKTISYKI